MAILAMASSLKLKVTAEGSETEQETAFLRFNHCDQVQGFFFSRPLTAQACTEFLREHFKRDKT